MAQQNPLSKKKIHLWLILMEKEDIKFSRPTANWKEVAEHMSKAYNLINLPIIHPETNELLGIVSVDDVLPWLLNER